MVVNQKVTGRASSMAGGLAVGGSTSLAVTLAGSVLCAVLVSREMIAETAIGYCALAILLMASFVGTSVAVGKIKHRRLYVCVLSGVIYYAALLALTALFFGGQYQGMRVTAMAVSTGCAIVILLDVGQGRSGRSRRHKIKHR